ncbi:MAG: T9SS type A sorting domain-containing protein [Bacteroidia bacterium]|nr:T9SS type A sorting domain-containing protein [Bacteroidia bacterium]
MANEVNNSNITGNMFNDQNIYTPLVHLGKGVTHTGVSAKNCNMTNIYNGNSFFCCNTGVEWYADNVFAKSDITENEFKGCINGLMFAQEQNPRTNTTTAINSDTSYQIQLDIRCNLFEQDSLAIVGSGKLIDQGTPTAGIKNKFINNINWDVATQNKFGYNYYSGSGGIYAPNPIITSLLKIPIHLNATQNWIGFKGDDKSFPINCSNGLLVHKDEQEEENVKVNIPFGVSLFPNPVDKGLLTIKFTDIPTDEIKVTLYNSVGQKLRSATITEKDYDMPMQHYAPGMYYIKMNNNTFRGTYKLIIK